MTIETLTYREDDVGQIEAGLRRMRRSAINLVPASDLRVSRALPVYRPIAERAGEAFDLASTRLAIWRYLIFAGDSANPSLEADLEPADSANALVAIAQAQENWLECLRAAETAASDNDYSLRIVEIPSADAAALWLHGADELCIDLMAEHQPRAVPAAAYVASINRLLEARRAKAARKPSHREGG